ncbi:MAG: hypothetical protein B7C54_11870 [Acidimicrobiales bacterium mtb01]|nr:MAG: hypothetical protein B7C54_11870 [Acidimicrobiales bacterium mtb01]
MLPREGAWVADPLVHFVKRIDERQSWERRLLPAVGQKLHSKLASPQCRRHQINLATPATTRTTTGEAAVIQRLRSMTVVEYGTFSASGIKRRSP